MKRIYFISLSLLLTHCIFAQSEENNEINSRFIDRKAKGFYNIMHVSLLLGSGQFTDRPAYYPPYGPSYYPYIVPLPVYYYPVKRTALTIAPSFAITNGCMFNEHWAAGAGVGFEVFNYNLFPLFAELRYTLWDHKISPFVVLKSGYSFAGFKARHFDELYLDWPPYYTNDARLRHYGGFMFNPEVGVKVPLNENSDLLLTAAYSYQKTKSIAKKEYDQGQFDEWEHKEEINRLSFGIAIMFR
ncbi:MAG: hypothetical protein K0B37_17050 [Bacteroidales bacterium]|nr:hypothetical protein [Bacteroidales bacterium]